MNPIKRFFLGYSESQLSQTESKAVLDILVAIMMSDGIQESTELEGLSKLIRQPGVDNYAEIEIYVELKKREFKEKLDLPTIFAKAAKNLPEPWMREHAFYLAVKFTGVDNEVHAGETEALHQLTTALEISRDKLREITRRIVHEERF